MRRPPGAERPSGKPSGCMSPRKFDARKLSPVCIFEHTAICDESRSVARITSHLIFPANGLRRAPGSRVWPSGQASGHRRGEGPAPGKLAATSGTQRTRPETISLLGSALEQAIAALPPDGPSQQRRTLLASRILRAASTGEKDPVRLREERWLHPRFESVIPALFWARLVRGAAVHGLRSPGSAFGFGIEIHRLRRSHPSIP